MPTGARVAVACDDGIDSLRVSVAIEDGMLAGVIMSVGKDVTTKVTGI
jgi:hypothetical protein